MKSILKKLCAALLTLALLLTCPVTALAADTFNAGVSITREENVISVTIAEDDDAFLAAQSPVLSVACDFEAVTVTFGDQAVPAVLKDGMVSFPVTAGGTYVITGTTGEAACPHPDENGDEVCDDCGSLLGAVMEGAIVGLKDSIRMEAYFTLSEKVLGAEDISLQITRPGETEPEVISLSNAELSGSFYCFTAEFSAKEMTDKVVYQIFADGEPASDAVAYSLRDYADIILTDSPSYSDADRTMIKAMLFYGSYAQRHFGYNPDALADDGLSMVEFDLDSVTAETLSPYANSAAQGTEKVTLMGSSLLLKSSTILRLFFKVDASVQETVTFKLGSRELAMHAEGSYCYVDITNIVAKDLCKDVTVTVNDGTEATVVYNPMSYCYTVLANAESHPETLVNMVKALYIYNQNAVRYFNG